MKRSLSSARWSTGSASMLRSELQIKMPNTQTSRPIEVRRACNLLHAIFLLIKFRIPKPEWRNNDEFRMTNFEFGICHSTFGFRN